MTRDGRRVCGWIGAAVTCLGVSLGFVDGLITDAHGQMGTFASPLVGPYESQSPIDDSCEPSFTGGDCHNYCLDLWGNYCLNRHPAGSGYARHACRLGPGLLGHLGRSAGSCAPSCETCRRHGTAPAQILEPTAQPTPPTPDSSTVEQVRGGRSATPESTESQVQAEPPSPSPQSNETLPTDVLPGNQPPVDPPLPENLLQPENPLPPSNKLPRSSSSADQPSRALDPSGLLAEARILPPDPPRLRVWTMASGKNQGTARLLRQLSALPRQEAVRR